MKSIRDKKLRGNLKALETKYRDAALKSKDAEILLENTSGFLEPENELERTFKVFTTIEQAGLKSSEAGLAAVQLFGRVFVIRECI